MLLRGGALAFGKKKFRDKSHEAHFPFRDLKLRSTITVDKAEKIPLLRPGHGRLPRQHRNAELRKLM